MQKELLQATKKIKQWAAKQKVLDVMIFGSAVRGKSSPKDMDLCIIIEDKDEEKSIDLADSLGSLLDRSALKPHISILTASACMAGNTLVKTLLNEGFSIKKNRNFSSAFGFENKSLFIYTLKKFTEDTAQKGY
jgi:predicted nucleotidyltransferase